MQRTCSHLTFFAAASFLTACGPRQETAPHAPPVVLVAEAIPADAPIFSEAVATLEGSTNTRIQSQVSGYLIKQAYLEGSVVKQGDLLFRIDPKPFLADLEQAQANLTARQAQLLRTKQELDRDAALVKSGAVSPPSYQIDLRNNLSAQADVDSAQASVATAKIKLGHTQIVSPVTGVAGRAIPGLGDLITAGITLTTVATVDPIVAEFTLPGPFYLNNTDAFAKASAVPLEDRPESIELILADGTTYPRRGKFYYVNHPVQTPAGAITAYALFPNPDRVLRPGQFAKVRGITRQITDAVLVPRHAVSALPGIDQVIVVGPDNKVEVRTVTTGDRSGDLWIVTSGLKVGERVVVEGAQKCRPGLEVDPQPYAAPPADLPKTDPPATVPNP
jgi:membrane fusion protein (multidrug efflux system)